MTEERTIVEGLNQFIRDRDRRAFLKLVSFGSAMAVVPVVMAGCEDPVDHTKEDDINLSSAAGPINLIYALLQLADDFVARVTPVGNRYPSMTTTEKTLFDNIASAWSSMKGTLQNTITSGRLTEVVLFDFSSVEFSSGTAVKGLFLDLADLMTQAANGVVARNTDANYLLLMAKLHSVNARIAAYIADTFNGGAAAADRTAFAALIDSNGLDASKTAAETYAQTDPYFRTVLRISGE